MGQYAEIMVGGTAIASYCDFDSYQLWISLTRKGTDRIAWSSDRLVYYLLHFPFLFKLKQPRSYYLRTYYCCFIFIYLCTEHVCLGTGAVGNLILYLPDFIVFIHDYFTALGFGFGGGDTTVLCMRGIQPRAYHFTVSFPQEGKEQLPLLSRK